MIEQGTSGNGSFDNRSRAVLLRLDCAAYGHVWHDLGHGARGPRCLMAVRASASFSVRRIRRVPLQIVRLADPSYTIEIIIEMSRVCSYEHIVCRIRNFVSFQVLVMRWHRLLCALGAVPSALQLLCAMFGGLPRLRVGGDGELEDQASPIDLARALCRRRPRPFFFARRCV